MAQKPTIHTHVRPYLFSIVLQPSQVFVSRQKYVIFAKATKEVIVFSLKTFLTRIVVLSKGSD